MLPPAVTASPTISGGSPGWLPAVGWLRGYQRAWLRGDLMAGLTLAAYLIPAGIADASLASLPPESGLFYFNIDHVRDTLVREVRGASPSPELLLLDLSAVPRIDLQAAQTLAAVHGELAGLGCQLQIVEARASVRDTLRLEGVEEMVGHINRFTSVADAVEEFLKGQLRESMK